MLGFISVKRHKKQIEKLKRQHEAECVLYERKLSKYFIQGLDLMREVKMLRKEAKKGDFSKVNLKNLAILCHPDKHGGSKLAHEAFIRIMEIRERK